MITRVGVVGSGVMGSGIAAQFANAGIPIELLDVPSPGPRRSETAERALIDARRRKPPPFMTDSAATLVRPGNTEDDLDRLAGCDWIVEAVVEDVGVKRELFRAIESVRRYGSVVSSNTSTIPRAELLAGAPPTLSPDFVIAHFFNPPRYLRLLELVAGQETRPEAIAVVAKTADVALGKSVVCCNDTPGFVANRIGLAWMNAVLKETVVRQLRVEDADAIASMAFGVPKTGVFGLFDLVGIDLALLVERSFRERLPASDPLRLIDPPVGLLETMAADGRTGRKGGGGFYRLERIDGQDVELALDIGSGEYRPVARPPRSIHSPGGLRTLVEADDEVGRFAWATLSFVLSYAASLVPEVCDAAAPIDLAMETGYGWRCGPFRLLDELGAADVANRLAADGQPVPPFLERAAAAGVFYETVDGVERALTIDSAPGRSCGRMGSSCSPTSSAVRGPWSRTSLQRSGRSATTYSASSSRRRRM